MTASEHEGGPGESASPGPRGPSDADAPPASEEQVGRAGLTVLAAGGVALGMHLMVGAAYALTLLLAPLWVNVLLALWWLALLLAGLLLLARRSLWVLAVPLMALASWMALVAAGRAWFGWH